MNRLLEALARLILIGIVAGVLAAGYLVYRLVESAVQAIDSAIGPTFYLIGAGILLLAFAVLTIGGALYAVGVMRKRLRQTHARDGLFPVEHGWNPNEAGAQTFAVMAQAGRRATSAMAGRVIDAHYRAAVDAMPEQMAALAPPALTVDSLAAVNLRTDPHWLLIGATGSGKTVASYAILAEITRRAPAEFVICELGGVNWPNATATTTPEIVRTILAVQAEMMRRQALLAANDADHIEDLPDPQPYLMLVVEEIDATLDDLRITGGREQRAAAVVALRAIARMGRKAGVCLFAVSTSGTTDVFDPHVRKNMSNVLLFRSEHTVSETWRLPGVRLTDLEPGAAYSLRHGAMIRFPYARRPRLLLASLAMLALETAEPVQQDAPILVQNWPKTAPVQPVLAGSAGSGPVLAANEEPSPELADLMRQWYAAGVSQNEILRRVWGTATWDGKNTQTRAALIRTLNL